MVTGQLTAQVGVSASMPGHTILLVQPPALTFTFPDGRPGPSKDELAAFYQRIIDALKHESAVFTQACKVQGDILYAQ